MGRLEDHTGREGALVLRTPCAVSVVGGPLLARDHLLLPLGNLGEPLTTRIVVQVGAEQITDVDTYHGWGA